VKHRTRKVAFRYTYRSHRPKGKPTFRPVKSPKDRYGRKNTITLRYKHYLMLREMHEFLGMKLSHIVGSLVVKKYCELLRVDNPEEAERILNEHKNDKLYVFNRFNLTD